MPSCFGEAFDAPPSVDAPPSAAPSTSQLVPPPPPPGLPPSTRQPGQVDFDCAEGIATWNWGWSDLKKQYCCVQAGKGCPSATPPP
mmetsp:Transcript_155384/g.498558  ORF Transcript_155384/g.498558 Transcript_155384/m.498558 type:complete len:86 (-) Transcript_155384:112-369(-)